MTDSIAPRPDPSQPHPTLGQIITCETTAAIIYHLRVVDYVNAPPFGNWRWGAIKTLCGKDAAWDRSTPPTERCINCMPCRVAAGWRERMPMDYR